MNKKILTLISFAIIVTLAFSFFIFANSDNVKDCCATNCEVDCNCCITGVCECEECICCNDSDCCEKLVAIPSLNCCKSK